MSTASPSATSAWLSQLEQSHTIVVGADLPPWRPEFSEAAPGQLVIPADELRALIVSKAKSVDPKGLTIRGAVIDGPLNLSGAAVGFPLTFVSCRFADDLDLGHARLHSLVLDGSAFSGRLVLSGCQVAGNLSLHGAMLQGYGDAGTSLVGDGIRVTESLSLDQGFHSIGMVSLTGGRIGGDLVMDGARLLGFDASRTSLSADGLRVDGKVSMSGRFSSAGTIRLTGANVGAHFVLRDASLFGRDADGCALAAENLRVTGQLSFGPKVIATGAIRLAGGQIGGQLRMQGVHLRGSDDEKVSLVADRLRVDDNTYLDEGFVADGAVKLIGARLGGYLSMSGAELRGRNTKGCSLVADRLRVDGNAFLGSMVCAGTVRLPSAHLTGSLLMGGASITGRNDAGSSVIADRLRVDGKLAMNSQFTTAGAVRLPSARIGGQLSFSAANLGGVDKDGRSLVADGMKCESKMLLTNGFSAAGVLSFATAEIQNLEVGKTPESLPMLGDATGWTVHDFKGIIRTDRKAAAKWLSTQSAAQPWHALADVYDRNGQPAEARWIRYKSAVRSTRNTWSTSRLVWLLRQLYRLTTGHGYYPLAALVWLALIFGLATTLTAVYEDQFTTATTATVRDHLKNEGRSQVSGRVPAAWCSDGWDTPCLDVFSYGLATAFPAIGPSHTWTPPDDERVLTTAFHAMRLLAWLFAAILLAGVTGLLRKQT